jgi:hypothetical protein
MLLRVLCTACARILHAGSRQAFARLRVVICMREFKCCCMMHYVTEKGSYMLVAGKPLPVSV